MWLVHLPQSLNPTNLHSRRRNIWQTSLASLLRKREQPLQSLRHPPLFLNYRTRHPPIRSPRPPKNDLRPKHLAEPIPLSSQIGQRRTHMLVDDKPPRRMFLPAFLLTNRYANDS